MKSKGVSRWKVQSCSFSFFFVPKSCQANISIPVSQLQWSSGKSGTFGYAQHHKQVRYLR